MTPILVTVLFLLVFELTFWFGWAIFYGSIPVLVGFLLWLAMFHCVIVRWEERDLETRFGDTYRAYKAQVPRWLGLPRRPGE